MNIGPPFFTIVLPTYNRAQIIGRAIESIISQTFTDWELIVIDDGSTDNTKEIVLSYNDKRIFYYWQENMERSAARNRGIQLAKGTFICFQDSDDAYKPNHLEVIFNAIKSNGKYKVFRTGLQVYENNLFVKNTPLKKDHSSDPYPFDCFTSFAFQYTVLQKIKFSEQFFIAEDLHFLIRVGQIYPFFQIEETTGICHYSPYTSGGIGSSYSINLENKIACLNDITIFNKKFILSFIRRQICLSELFLLTGHIRYNLKKIPYGIMRNFGILLKYPNEYFSILFRIIYVKFGDASGIYHSRNGF